MPSGCSRIHQQSCIQPPVYFLCRAVLSFLSLNQLPIVSFGDEKIWRCIMRRAEERILVEAVSCHDERDTAFLLAAASAMLFSATLAVPAFAVLPVVASVALAGASLAALAARLPALNASRTRLSDLAGACMFVGVAAAIFSRPAQVVQTFDFLAR
jgi:hypothetical protein